MDCGSKVERLWNLPSLEILSFVECDALKDMTNLGAASSVRYILFSHQRWIIPPLNVEALKNVVVMDETWLVLSVCPSETELRKYLPKDDDDDAPYWLLVQHFPCVHARAHQQLEAHQKYLQLMEELHCAKIVASRGDRIVWEPNLGERFLVKGGYSWLRCERPGSHLMARIHKEV
ncbi:hypothetical protein QJS10_CPB15g01451 [Acorus calamus]|uniref:Uncharacterized protein n=1 Tax=Acorus calamus TaxID=4465 RepID=A0AAV9D8L6_ACOCL|nr:hypothetical protein QJS10_CPB15g01451 [Acorus calamus]